MVSIIKWGVAGTILAIIAGSLWLQPVQAEKSQSTNFQATGMEFDPFGSTGGCSGDLCSEVRLGSGLQAPSVPQVVDLGPVEPEGSQLDLAINHGTTELGELSVSQASLKTVEITVRGYDSNGYMLYIMGKPPRIGSHTLHAIGQPSKSRPGTEQFGINLVANSQPQVGGTVTSKLPDASPKISPQYAEPNKFTYSDGDIIAASTSNSSRDTYIVSMIINVSNSTPPGEYNGGFGVMAVPGF